jgi:hypothetical protein
MKTTDRTASSTFQEWSTFVQVLNDNKNSSQPLLKSSGDTEKLIHHLKQEFRRQPVYPTFVLRYKRGKQLALSL